MSTSAKELFPQNDSRALIDEHGALSFEELAQHSDALVKGIPARSLVCLIASNTFETALAYVGCLRNGIIPLMVSASLNEKLLDGILEAYEPEYIWAPQDKALEGDFVAQFRSYNMLRTSALPTTKPDAKLALLLGTSGSTGSPKYVRLSLENLVSNAASIAEYLEITGIECAISTLPFSYSYGLSIINSHLFSGASVVLTDRSLFDRGFWELLAKHRATNFGGVPYTYAILKRLGFEKMDLPSLRYITQAGGHLGEELHREFAQVCAKKNIGFYVMYGQTEATARISYLAKEKSLEKTGSIGKAIPGGKLILQDEKGEQISEAGKCGELVYSGPNVSLGYAFGRSCLGKGDENCGVLHTGDIALFDSEGFFRIVGRKSRFLKLFGNRINLDEIESLLAQSGYTAACCGIDDRMDVYLERRDLDAIAVLLCELTGLHKSALSLKGIEKIPRTEAGKVDYVALEDRY
ncbi:MAG: AMP-binding protein [Eggerthellaceae bacterium]|nr:AMP-binding protein [Eggerthellaceae bacterium]